MAKTKSETKPSKRTYAALKARETSARKWAIMNGWTPPEGTVLTDVEQGLMLLVKSRK